MRLIILALLLIPVLGAPVAAQQERSGISTTAARDTGAVSQVGSPDPATFAPRRSQGFPTRGSVESRRPSADPIDRMAAGVAYGGLGGAFTFGLGDYLLGPFFGDDPELSSILAGFIGLLAGMVLGAIAGLLSAI